MAAGLGFKDFTTGEVLTAADVDGYLMQGVWVFASAAARDAAVTSPQEGNFAYLKDTNVTTYYTGSAWANLDTTGMTNPMTTTGDMVYSSSGSTPARLGIGSTGNVLTVSGGVPVWSAPAGGGKVLQVVTATYSTVTEINSGTYTDTGLTATITPSSSASKVLVLISQPSKTQIRASTQELQYRANYKLLRGATDINVMPLALGITGSANSANWEGYAIANMNYLDSPATTSATTYKTQGSGGTNSGVVFQNSSGTATMTLLEIGA
jgi:hypothetical protein